MNRAMIHALQHTNRAMNDQRDLNDQTEEAQRNGALLPVTALVDQFYAEVQQRGGRRWDTSSLITRLQPPSPNPAEL